jgi:AcrR family transcriptional regulator
VPARKPQDERHAATHEALLAAAVGVLARQGAAATTLRDVAQAAGVSYGALTYHFKNREELLDVVLARCALGLRSRLTAALEASSGAPASRRSRELLAAASRALSPREPEAAVLLDLAALSMHDPRLRAKVSLCLAELETALGDALVAPRLAAGLSPRVPAGTIARLCLGALLGDGLLEPAPETEPSGPALALERALAGLFEV